MTTYLLFGSVSAAAGYQAFQFAKTYKEELDRTIQQLQQQNRETADKLVLLARHVKDLELQLNSIDDKTPRNELELSDFEVNDSMTSSITPPFAPAEEPPQEESQSSLRTLEESKEEPHQRNGGGHKTKKEAYVEEQLQVVEAVRKEAAELEGEILGYKGAAGDRGYKQYNEILIRFLIRLDLIDCKGDEKLREARQEAKKYLQRLQTHLKTK